MKNKLIVTRHGTRILSCLFSGDELIQVNIEETAQQADRYRLGNIYAGKVKNIVRNINAAFVEIENHTLCYLDLNENKNPVFINTKNNTNIAAGDELLVQISRESVKTKGPTVSSNLNFTGKYLVLTHGKAGIGISGKLNAIKERERLRNIVLPFKSEDYGFIIRTNAAGVPADTLEKELLHLRSQYEAVKASGIHRSCFSLVFDALSGFLCDIRDSYDKDTEEIVTDDEELFQEMLSLVEPDRLRLYHDPQLSLASLYGIEDKISRAVSKKVWLKSGGYLVIEPTEALTVIDVNSGKAVNGHKNPEENFYRINNEAAVEIAKQLRLRNLSGIIIVDFIDMRTDEYRKAIMTTLSEQVLNDPVRTAIIDMTALNLVEITRKKIRKPLHEQIKNGFC